MDSFFIRPERSEDIDAIFEVNYQAFAQDGEARLGRTVVRKAAPDDETDVREGDAELEPCPVVVCDCAPAVPASATAIATTASFQPFTCVIPIVPPV